MTDDETTGPAGASNPQGSDAPGIQKPAETPPAPPAGAPSPQQVPPAPLPESEPSVKTGSDDKNNIAAILEGIKLPERRDFKASGDVQKGTPKESEAAILEEHIVKAAAGRNEDAPPPVSSDQEESDSEFSSVVTPLRTLKDDMATIVRDKKISLVRAATLEEEKKHGQEHLAPEQQEIRSRRSRRTTGILLASLILIVLGGLAIAGVLYVASERAAAPTTAQSSILFSEQTVAFALDNQQPQTLKNALAQASQKELGQLGSITRVVPTINSTSSGQSVAEPATLAQFFSALGIAAPPELMGAIGPDFFFGFHVVDTNVPLFVIPVTSYDHAFAGMLAWEKTMDQDLEPVFTAVSPTKLDSNGVPEARTFQDGVLRNYDVRELTDDSGNVVLYYSFPTPNILVIAESTYSFTEILSRLQAGREL